MAKITFFIVIFSVVVAYGFGVTAAHRLVKEVKGVQVDPQPFEWKTSVTAPKTIDLVINPFFKVKMSKSCYELSPNGGGDDIAESLGLVIERLKKCPSYVGGEELPNFFTLTLTNWSTENFESVEKASVVNQVYRRTGKINSYPAALMLSADMNSKNKVVAYWHIYLQCKGNHFMMVGGYPSGQPSIDIIRSRKFEIPQDFKDIILSFECTGKNVK